MTNRTITANQTETPEAAPKPAAPLSVGIFVIFAFMLVMAVVSVAYAVSMIGFLGDGGYFLAYASLCGTVPVVAAIDQFLPFLVAGGWVFVIWLGLTRNRRFRRATSFMSLASLVYGSADMILGPFTFRVGPADFDPDSVQCGRWPRSLSQEYDLQVMQIDWFGLPISTFALSLIFLSLAILVYMRVSRSARAIYGR